MCALKLGAKIHAHFGKEKTANFKMAQQEIAYEHERDKLASFSMHKRPRKSFFLSIFHFS